MNRTGVRCVLAGVLALLIAACATPPKVRVDQDTRVNLAAYQTFAWLEPVKSEPGVAAPPNAAPTSLQVERVKSAVISALKGKGYELDEARPEFRVTYVLHIFERPKDSGMRIGLGAGGGSGRVGGSVGLSIPVGTLTTKVGSMTIDIVDVARNAQVWTGTYEDTMSEPPTDADVNRFVAAILAKYPSRAR